MDSHATNQYIRQILHHTEPPPAIEARFFYTSPLPIDDPLSPLPPPAANTNVPLRQPPKPFSRYDNKALDKAWHVLRRKILQYHEERGEKPESHDEGSRSRQKDGDVKGSRVASGSDPATPSTGPARLQAFSVSQVDGSADLDPDPDMLDGPAAAAETSQVSNTTGTPFIRAPSRTKITSNHARDGKDGRNKRPMMQPHDTYAWEDPAHLAEHSPVSEMRKRQTGPTDKVAVGVSRLHQVEMPDLRMIPIYWTPVNDIAQVVRGTWFYQDTMQPVEASVAIMLEAGYVDLQVWTQTWKDELDSAVEVGAAGEAKIVHKLWLERPLPKLTGSNRSDSGSRPPTADRENLLRVATANLVDHEIDTPEHRRDMIVEAASDLIDISTGPGGPDNKAAGTTNWGRQGSLRTYNQCGVIYANEKEARILKANLLPSSYYGRRPLANYIRKGHKIGIPVVRGFDQATWDKLYPSKSSPKAERAGEGLSTSASGAQPSARRKTDPDLARAERPNVTDLVLVIHGIGQKLSQRMEAWHFTHAINAFRREVNVEVGSKECKTRFRKDMGGIMVLPINWRHSLSFEEGGYQDDDDHPTHNAFNLLDITPDTLPSVRNIVSDVMLDIPYYMSHHQPKMIAAVIREANRVYRLWCQNNPGFAGGGRVHVIAHSLGSVMSVDILSKQPTRVPGHLADPTTVDADAVANLDFFLFNTHHLFLAGSPAGFFLLLRKAQLLPRLDSPSAAAREDPSALKPTICGERGQYGCIAVENIYNIINGYDPVAYRMNAAVDATYSASLKKAWVPSASSGWFTGSRATSLWGGGAVTQQSISAAANPSATEALSSSSRLPRLPSNVELETHDFTREELAEKRMRLLNDNAQIDFFLRYGGGPLEIQYLTMLGAHSSYWLLKDFTRMVVVEVGRTEGQDGTVMGMRAAKAKAALK